MSRLSMVQEVWEFLKVRKKFWLLPIIVMLLGLGMIIAFAASSAFAPFIYTLF